MARKSTSAGYPVTQSRSSTRIKPADRNLRRHCNGVCPFQICPKRFVLNPSTFQICQMLNLYSSFPCNLTSKQGILEVANKIREHENHLDILISNAGIRRDPPQSCNVLTAPLPELQASLWSSEYDDWTQSFQVNTMAHYYLSAALLDMLAKAGDREMPMAAEDGIMEVVSL